MFSTCFTRKNGPLCLASRNIRTDAKYHINADFLERGLVTHRHAWFWGIFLTDGFILRDSRNRARYKGLGWHQKFDSYPMLNAIREIVESNHPIVFDCQLQRNKKFPTSTLALYSSRLANAATSLLGCDASRKTFDLQFPRHIDPIFLSALIRGIVDGDGSWAFNICRASVVFVISSANELFLIGIRHVIDRDCLNTTASAGKIYPNGNNFALKYHKQEECLAIGKWLYKGNEQGIIKSHKYNRFVFIEKLQSSGWSLQTKSIKMQEYKEQEVEKCAVVLRSIIALRDSPNTVDGFHFREKFYQVSIPG